MRAWKDNLTDDFDPVDRVILELAEGRPGKIEEYRWHYTHRALIEAYISKIITS